MSGQALPLAHSPDASLLRALRGWALGAAAAVLAAALLGRPPLALGLLVGAAFAAALWRAPLRYPALALFFVALVVNNPAERPADGHFNSALSAVGNVLFENLNNLTGISSLRFAAIEVVLAAFAMAVVLRRAAGLPAGPAGPKRPLGVNAVLGLSLLTLLSLEVRGLASGGDFKASLWQIRQLLLFPIVVWVFQAAELGPRDLLPLGLLILGAAALKAAEGVYVYQVLAHAEGARPAYVTTHSDTELFVAAALVAVVGWLLWRSRLRWLAGGALALPLLGMVVNNRRLAFVSLIANLALIYAALPPSRLKSSLARLALAASPFGALYAAVGWRSTAGVFAPAHMIATVLSKTDTSAGTRDVENYNLIQTLKVHPFLGWGFGHPYLELSRAYDISNVFPLYRYIGHNSVLWLWSVGGLLGFAAVWLPVGLTVFFAARCLRAADQGIVRGAALVGLTVPVTYMLQAYGDMGLQSWSGGFLLAASLAALSRSAVALGAWPAVRPRPIQLPGDEVPWTGCAGGASATPARLPTAG